MLVLSRNPEEWVTGTIGEITFRVIVIGVRGSKVKLGFEAPPEVAFERSPAADAKTEASSSKSSSHGAAAIESASRNS